MRSFYIILSLIFLILHLASCDKGPLEVREYSPEGILVKKYYMDEDSIQQGDQYTYYNNGKSIFEKASYVDGQLYGQRILYFENGQPEVIENYNSNLLNDTLYVYYPSGALKMTSYFENGIHSGINTAYYENGNIKEQVQFVNNEEQGPFTEYYKNGQIHWEGQYLNGDNEFGELVQYDSLGQMIKKMVCDSLSICTTIWSREQNVGNN